MQVIRTSLVAAGTAIGVSVVRRIAANRTASRQEPANRWLAVTVNAPVEAITQSGRLPEPLERLSDTVEVRVLPAPGGRGTELAARLREPGARLAGKDPRQDVRLALREAKSLVETGEVLRPDAPATTRGEGRL
jgi:hypothetical protein